MEEYNLDHHDSLPGVGEPEMPRVEASAHQSSGSARFLSKAERDKRCITLEESENRITELIHNHFHPAE